ncbi:MAG TPA: zf-HC2 domain-containing protein [Pyrinomonadaceae bacterium]|nr:zf-HC2 domain-containing protein [Pyrinomonadaceae bacterium]
MHCTSIERFLQTYIDGELDAATAARAEAHLQSCANCTRLVSEYRDMQQWMRLYTPPDFGEDFFAGINRNVLNKIRQDEARPGFAHMVAGFFSQTAWAAASIALLVLASAVLLSLYVNNSRAPQAQQAAEAPRPTVADDIQTAAPTVAAAQPPSEAGGAKPLVASTQQREASLQERRLEAGRIAFNRKASLRNVAGARASSVGRPAATLHVAARGSVEELPLPAPTEARTNPPEAAETTSETSPASRIEMQTSDPSVRIIWLVSQRTATN